jgi:hypothetical protein
VIFDEGSGQTHQMDAVRAFLVNCLCDEIHSSASLAVELANVTALAKIPNIPELVETILDELCVHGLVEVTNA